MPKRKSASQASESQSIDDVLGNEENVPENVIQSPRRRNASPTKQGTPQKETSKSSTPKSAEKSKKKKDKKNKDKGEDDGKKKKKKKSKKNEDEGETSHSTLFRKSAVSGVIEEVMQKYTKEPKKTVAKLLNFIIEAAGCPNRVNAADVDIDEIENFVQLNILTKEYLLKAEGDYPLSSKKSEFKKFKENYIEFWTKLLTKSQDKVLYDGYFTDIMNSWLSVFTVNKVRSLRHSATLAALGIISSLVKIAGRVSQEYEIANRQLKTEKKSQSNSQKYSQLVEKTERLQENSQLIDSKIAEFFTGIIAQHRYRDIVPEIRAAVIRAIGSWIRDYPAYFLELKYLKYIGWSLHDKNAEVRRTTLEMLELLFSSQTFITQLSEFVDRYKPRFKDMTTDVDIEVGRAAVRVMTILDKWGVEINQNHMLHLLTDDNVTIRFEAATFIFEHQFKNKKDHSEILQEVIKLIQSELPNYIVDALWAELRESFTDWSALTDLLLEDQNSLSDEEQLLLVRTINACVKKAAGNQITPKTKLDPEQKDRKDIIRTNVENLSKHFMKLIPKMLNSFKASASIVSELSEIPQYFDLEIYSAERAKNSFKDLLKTFQELYLTHSDESALESIAATFKHLLTATYDLKNDAQVKFDALLDELVSQLTTVLGVDDPTEDEIVSQMNNLKRFEQLSKKFDLTERSSEVYDLTMKVLRGPNSELLAPAAIGVLYNLVLWYMKSIDPASPNMRAVSNLTKKRDALFDQLHKVLLSTNEENQYKAFLVLCDLLIVFSSSLREVENPAFQQLAYFAKEELIVKMRDYLNKELDDSIDIERNTTLVAAFARPLSFNCIPDSVSSALLMRITYPGKIPEIVKSCLSCIRELERQSNGTLEEWKWIYHAIQTKYEKYIRETGEDEKQEQLEEFTELCTRLANTYGVSAEKRSVDLERSLESLISKGIDYAFDDREHRLRFLSEGIVKFVSKLPAKTATAFYDHIVNDVATELDPKPDEDNEDDAPYFAFLQSLKRGDKGDKGEKETGGESPKKKSKEKSKKSSSVVRPLALEPVSTASSKSSTASTSSKKRKGSEVTEPTPIRKSPRKTPEKSQKNEKQSKKVLEEDDIQESEEEQELQNKKKKKKSKQTEEIEDSSEEKEKEKPKKSEKASVAVSKPSKPKPQTLYGSDDEQEKEAEDETVLEDPFSKKSSQKEKPKGKKQNKKRKGEGSQENEDEAEKEKTPPKRRK